MSRSVGCETCEKRRVKCDGARPNCSQCRLANRICFSLPEKDTKFAFVIETFPFERPIAPSCDKTREGQKHRARREQHPILKSQISRNTSRPWIRPPLAVPLENQAVAYYFHHQIISPVEIIEAAQDYTRYLPLMWQRSARDSAFYLAILASSYCAFGKLRNNQAAAKASKLMYFRAISTVSKSLQIPSEFNSDQILLATMVLSFYELASWDCGGKDILDNQLELSQHKSRCFCHITGATALLKARQQEDPLAKRTSDLDKLVRRQVVRSALDRKTGVPSWLEDGIVFGESGLPLELDKWTIRITQKQREVQALLIACELPLNHGKISLTTRLLSLIEEVNILDSEMLLWTTHLAPEWWYQTHVSNSESLRGAPYGSVRHSYSSLSHAIVWNQYRTLRIIIKSMTIKLLRLWNACHGYDADLSVQDAISSIRDIVDDICASIPFFTGEVTDASVKNEVKAKTMAYLSFPLSTIINNFSISGTSYIQQQWIRNRLSSIGQVTNYNILEKLAFP